MSNLKKIINWWLGGGSSYSYSPQYQAVLDWAAANGATPPSSELNKQAEDIFVRSWVYEGAWAIADQLIVLSSRGDGSFSLINFVNPGVRNFSQAASPSFSAGNGWSSAGSLVNYLRTNYIPSIHADNLTQNDAGILFYTPTNEATSATKVEFGGNEAALLDAIVSSIFASSSVNIRLNGSTNLALAVSTSNGFYQFKRNSSSQLQVFKDGILVGTSGVNNSTGLPGVELYVLVYNNNGAAAGGTTKVAGFWAIGANFVDAVQPLRMEFNLPTYYDVLQTIQEIITPPNFSSWQTSDIAAYLTSIGGLAATYSASPRLDQIFLKGASLVGSNKWQGCALAENGCIYAAPSTAQTVLKIDTSDDTYSTVPTAATAGLAKYGGAVYAQNGKIYFCPQTARAVMVIDTADDSSYFFDSTGIVANDAAGNMVGGAKWYGIYQGSNGLLYCIPYNATEILVIDPSDDSITFIDTAGATTFGAGNLTGAQKWDGGCVYGDLIYASPSDATDFLKIDTDANTCSRFGTAPAGTAKWAISTIGPNGYIYMFPYFDNRVLKLNPADDTFSYLATTIGSIDTTIKIGACSVMPDGRILALPCEQTQARIINTSTDTLSTIGRSLSDVTTLRWIGGALANNGAFYGIPFAGQFVIKNFYGGKRTTLSNNFTLNKNGRYS